jgi:hypothetical protein
MAEPGENPRFWPLTGAIDGDVSYVFEGIIEVKLQAPSANLRGKPQIYGSDDGATPMSSPPWGHQSWRCASTWTSGWFCGGAVFFYCIDSGGSQRHGVMPGK